MKTDNHTTPPPGRREAADVSTTGRREASTGWRRAHVVAAPIAGGVVDHVIDAARFDPCGPVPIVLPPWPGLDRAARRAERHGVPVVRAAPPPRPDGVAAWLAGAPVDLVHVHYATPFDCTAIVEMALGAGIAVVSTDHAHPAAFVADAAAWERRRRVAPLQAARLADSTAIALALEGVLAFGIDDTVPLAPPRVQLVAHGIDIEHFEAVPERGAARAALGLPAERRVVGVVAALFDTKGVHDVLAAAAQVQPAPIVVVAGEGPERPRLEQLATRLGVETRLLGWMDDVRPLLAAADVVALASRSEGLPTVVLQAMAAGTPVVATGVPGTLEALGPFGVCVMSDDAAGFATALEIALLGGVNAQRDAARARVRSCFDSRRMAAEISAVHRAVLGAM